ncbi:MAG TPA: DUF2147 domain-containing protein [Bacteroidia bacterium]|nr:DUF2147 domain-containing protein [Bacteroidia bacterium]
MKKLILLFCLFTFTALNSQNKASDIIGTYMNPEADGVIKIYENAGKYFGKIIWTKNPDRLDESNPDVTKRTQKRRGLVIMNNFKFDGDDTWEDGTIYDPKNGKTYDCKVTRDAKGNLDIRGFIGISLLGRTSHFTKIDFKEQ